MSFLRQHNDMEMGRTMAALLPSENEFTWSKSVLTSLFEQAGIKVGTSLSTSMLLLLLGENTLLLTVLVFLIALDIITGISKAVHTETFTTERLRKGGVKLFMYILLMIVAHVFTYIHPMLNWFDDAVFCYIGLTEYESIAENLLTFGVNWPSISQAKNALTTLKGNKDDLK